MNKQKIADFFDRCASWWDADMVRNEEVIAKILNNGGVKEGDTLILGERSYLFRRTELYYYRNQAVYQWGMCVEKGVNDTWGIPSWN